MEVTRMEQLAWWVATGHDPHPYQVQMLRHWMGLTPSTGPTDVAVHVPMGAGKLMTAVVAWYLAVLQNQNVPRRMYMPHSYRVLALQAKQTFARTQNRIADIATGDVGADKAERCMAAMLHQKAKTVFASAPHRTCELVAPLLSMAMGGEADDSSYAIDPSMPALITGTHQMISASPLYAAPRRSRKTTSMFAGLAMHDAAIVIDESHISLPTLEMFRDLQADQAATMRKADQAWMKPLHILSLSATPPPPDMFANHALRPCRLPKEYGGNDVVKRKVVSLSPADKNTPILKRILFGKKRFVIAVQSGQVNAFIASCVLKRKGEDLLGGVFVDSPEDAMAIAKKLRAVLGDDNVAVVTGTMVGYDRLRQAEQNEVIRRFVEKRPKTGKGLQVVVGTSAINNGIDGSFDFAVMTGAELPIVLQRAGRIGRLGDDVEIIIVVEQPKNEQQQNTCVWQTAMYLKESLGDEPATTDRLMELYDKAHARCFAKPKTMLPVSPEALNRLAMQNVGYPEEWAVNMFIFGDEEECRTVQVAWRDDLDILAEACREKADDEEENEEGDASPPIDFDDAVAKIFDVYPVVRGECLQDVASRISSKITGLAAHCPDKKAVLVDHIGGSVYAMPISVLAALGPDRLVNKTVVLPTSVGGKNSDGQLDKDALEPANDQADHSLAGRQRFHCYKTGNCWELTKFGEDESTTTVPRLPATGALLRLSSGTKVKCLLVVHTGTNTAVLYTQNPYTATSFPCDQGVTEHCAAVAFLAKKYAVACGLPPMECEEFYWAGNFHDLGKMGRNWAESVGFEYGMAKQGDKKSAFIGLLAGGRHEATSFLMACLYDKNKAILAQPLRLTLIAMHHGMIGRPGVPSTAVIWKDLPPDTKKEEVEFILMRVAESHEAMVERYGRWGLSWMEAIFRAADWMVSMMDGDHFDALLDEAGYQGPRADRR